ncbi:MAG TPA: transcriptional regulator [Rhodospirillaceae bacterium]|nr:transcriptional regulator [Rhodospirillaceae bacterium]
MSKFGKELLEAMGEALAHAEERPNNCVEHSVLVPEDIDVRALRKRLGLSRPAFAARFDLDARAVQDWEQRRRRPDRAARAYLKVIALNPQAVDLALAGE